MTRPHPDNLNRFCNRCDRYTLHRVVVNHTVVCTQCSDHYFPKEEYAQKDQNNSSPKESRPDRDKQGVLFDMRRVL